MNKDRGSRMYRVKITDYDHFTGTPYHEYRHFRHRLTALLYAAVMRCWRGAAELEGT